MRGRTRQPTPAEQARMRKIVQLVAEGKSNKEIAREVHLAAVTVEQRVSYMTRMIDGTNRVHLAVWAVRNGYA